MANIINLLQKKDINKGSEVLADAFKNDDFVSYILEHKKHKHQKMVRLFKCAIKFGLLYGKVYVTENLEGICIIFPPNQYKRPIWRWIRSGAVGMIKELGLDFLKRENPTTDLRDKIRYNHMKNPHWYLYIIAVDPIHQKKGYASQLLNFIIKKIYESNLPIYLDTNTIDDVPIYEHFGFKVIEKFSLPTPPRTDIFNWCMVKYL